MKKVLVVWMLVLTMLVSIGTAAAEGLKDRTTEELYQMMNEITTALSAREAEYAKDVAQRLVEVHAEEGSKIIIDKESDTYYAFMDLGEDLINMDAGEMYGGYRFMFSDFDGSRAEAYSNYIADFLVAINPEIIHEAAYAKALKLFMTEFAYTEDGKAVMSKREFGLNITIEVFKASETTALIVTIG